MDWTSRCFQDVTTSTGETVRVATIQGLECIFSNFLQIATTLAGLVLFIVLILGGIKYMTSGGDQKGSEQARGMIGSALFGIILLIIAWLILKFISEFTGLPNLPIFKIPGPD
jgi:uncharacterized membrane protein